MNASITRERQLGRAQDGMYDLIVIGGGINGCGVAWEAAERGLTVLLLEKEDFGWATSAWNSRLIHGGLKYLEKLDLPLVRESLREREWLLRAAPHLVKPLEFMLPFYRSNKHHPLVLELGMTAYDVLSFDKSTPWHRLNRVSTTLKKVPALARERLSGSSTYFDGQCLYPERLSFEVALAAQRAGAVVLNHARVDKAIFGGEGVAGVEFTDTIAGERHTVHAQVVINAAGPWVDEILYASVQEPERLMGGTKGTHLVVGRFEGAPDIAVYYEAISDGRPMMVIPWLDTWIIGATDVRFEGDLDTATIDAEELRYILDETNRLFPSARLRKEDVLWSYTGVRPLPYAASGPTGDITRRHSLHDHGGRHPDLRGLYSLVGGKLTTFRAVSQDIVDSVLPKHFPELKRMASPTRRSVLPGAGRIAAETVTEGARRTGLPDEYVQRIFNIYGRRGHEVLESAAAHGGEPVRDGDEVVTTVGEVVFCLEAEQALTVNDLMARRLMLGMRPDLGLSVLEDVARVAGGHLGWGADEVQLQVDGYREYVEKLLTVNAL